MAGRDLINADKTRNPKNDDKRCSKRTLKPKATKEFPFRFRETTHLKSRDVSYSVSLMNMDSRKPIKSIIQGALEPIEIIAKFKETPVAILRSTRNSKRLKLVDFNTTEIPFEQGAAFIDFDSENRIFYAMPLNASGKVMSETIRKYDPKDGTVTPIPAKDYFDNIASESRQPWCADEAIEQRFFNKTEIIEKNTLEVIEEESENEKEEVPVTESQPIIPIKTEMEVEPTILAKTETEEIKDFEALNNLINSNKMFATLLAKEVANLLVNGKKIETVKEITPKAKPVKIVEIIEDTPAPKIEKIQKRSKRDIPLEETTLPQALNKRRNWKPGKKESLQDILDRIAFLKSQEPKKQRTRTKKEKDTTAAIKPLSQTTAIEEKQIVKLDTPVTLILPPEKPKSVTVVEIRNDNKSKSLKIGNQIVLKDVFGLNYVLKENNQILHAWFANKDNSRVTEHKLFYPDAKPVYTPKDPKAFIEKIEIELSFANFYSVSYELNPLNPTRYQKKDFYLELENYKNLFMTIDVQNKK
ncbi:MAG: hypothetical protein FWE50_00790 [Alphaproteobacteria bacterium]|nr:hypothetical protein [Alphaproteobacteria bacterium]